MYDRTHTLLNINTLDVRLVTDFLNESYFVRLLTEIFNVKHGRKWQDTSSGFLWKKIEFPERGFNLGAYHIREYSIYKLSWCLYCDWASWWLCVQYFRSSRIFYLLSFSLPWMYMNFRCFCIYHYDCTCPQTYLTI